MVKGRGSFFTSPFRTCDVDWKRSRKLRTVAAVCLLVDMSRILYSQLVSPCFNNIFDSYQMYQVAQLETRMMIRLLLLCMPQKKSVTKGHHIYGWIVPLKEFEGHVLSLSGFANNCLTCPWPCWWRQWGEALPGMYAILWMNELLESGILFICILLA